MEVNEAWVPIHNYEGFYEISNTGIVRSVDRVDNIGRFWAGKERSTKKNNRGYVQVSLNKDGASSYFLLHRLVAEHFIENRKQLPQVNHKDENKNNNAADNLEWCTNIYNRRYGTGYERSVQNHDYKKIADGNYKKVKQFDLPGNLIKIWQGVIVASREMSIHEASIRACCYGKTKTAGGYRWEYA